MMGSPVYHEYDTSGAFVTGGLQIDFRTFGFGAATGAAMAPDGQSLYFIVQASLGTGAQQTLMQMDLSGNLLSLQGTTSTDIEGIAVVAP